MNVLLGVFPDALLFSALCVLVLVAAFTESRRVLTWAAVGVVFLYLWGINYQDSYRDSLRAIEEVSFQQMFSSDISALNMKRFAGLVTLAILFFLESCVFKQPSEKGKEASLIVLFGLLGTSLMVGSSHFLVSVLGLELLSLALVVLIAWGLEKPQLEAAVKYFILSSLASGILLFGISLIYGATGHLEFVPSAMVRYPFYPIYLIGQIFLIAGVAFKLGWVPFHFWLSDVYASARWYMIVALGSLSKIGVLGFMLRLFSAGEFTMPGFAWSVQLIVVLSILSIFIGNILAVQQNNLRRILAYSSVANMGFLGLALACNSGAPFYLAIYVLNTLAVAAIMYTHWGTQLDISLSDLRGFGLHYPYQGIILAFAMLSFAGIPLTPGFWAKWHVFQEFFAQYSPLFGIFIVLGTLIGTFYYIRIIKYLYEEEDHAAEPVALGFDTRAERSFLYVLVLGCVAGALLWCTAFPDQWLNWSSQITGSKKVAVNDAGGLLSLPSSSYQHRSVPVIVKVPFIKQQQTGKYPNKGVIEIFPQSDSIHAR